MRKLASVLVLLRWRRVLATAGHRFLGNIRLRQSRSGDNAHKTAPLFVTPYYTAGNGCNGTGPAGRALRCRKLRQCQESSSGKISYFRFSFGFPSLKSCRRAKIGSRLEKCYLSLDAFVYAKSAGSDRRLNPRDIQKRAMLRRAWCQ